MNYEIITVGGQVPFFDNRRQFDDGTIHVKTDKGHFFSIWASYGREAFSIVNIYENEKAFFKVYPMFKYETWRQPNPGEKKLLDELFSSQKGNDVELKFEIEDMGQKEYEPLLNGLSHSGTLVTGIDYERCEITYLCCSCGEKHTVSMFEPFEYYCRKCSKKNNSTVLLGTTARNWELYVRGEYFYQDFFFRTREDERKIVISVSEDEETLSFIGARTYSVIQEDKITLGHLFEFGASYSINAGVKATKVVDRLVKPCDFDALLEETVGKTTDYFSFRSVPVSFHCTETLPQFLVKHQNFFEKVAFFDYWGFQPYYGRLDKQRIQASMLRYLMLIHKHPFLVTIAKNGYTVISKYIFETLLYSHLDKLITKWETVFSENGPIPMSVLQTLKKRNVSYSELEYWVDHWSDFNLTEEEFNDFTGDEDYSIFKMEVGLNETLAELVKRGYTLKELKSYLIRECCNGPEEVLKRYLDKCREQHREPEKFPDLKTCLDF